MYTSKRLDEECTAICKLKKVMSSMLSLVHLCEEAQVAVALLHTYLHKVLILVPIKVKCIKPGCITNIRKRSQ